MDCKVCYVPFDKLLRCPRNLECGHSFCSSCLENILESEGTLICPECRVWRDVDDVSEVPVSYGVLRVIEAMRGDDSKTKEEEEEEGPLFILPMLKKDEEHKGESKGEAAEANEESATEQLRECYRNILWPKITSDNIEELQSYDRTINSVIRACQADLQILERIVRSRQTVTEYLQGEVECNKREQEAAEVKKKELFECKEQCDVTGTTADIYVLPDGYIQQRNRLEKLLEVEEETTEQLRKFSSCICGNDKTLMRTHASEDSIDIDLTNLFVEMADRW